MASFNKVFLIGNLCADPELKYLPKGTAVCQFNLAVNRKWRDEAGQQKEEAAFIGVKAWGRQAETIAEYCKKGKPLLVEGRLTQEVWEKDGKKNSKTIVTLESFQFLNDGQKSNQTESQPRPPTAGVPVSGGGAVEDDGQDVPF